MFREADRRRTFRIRAGHTDYMRRLINDNISVVNNRGTGLYYCRIRQTFSKVASMERVARDTWLLRRKRAPRIIYEGKKHTLFE
jgi:hypothetical protein